LDNEKVQKANRILELFLLLMKGEELSVKQLADRLHVSSRSISRDISEIKIFLAENRDIAGNAELYYSSINHKYRLNIGNLLTNKELLVVSKILIGSRAITTEALVDILDKIKANTSSNDRDVLEKLIRKEIYHYAPVYTDNKDLIDLLWKITRYIEQRRFITIDYYKMDRSRTQCTLKPLAVIFSEYYFYLIAYKENNDKIPLFFRIDRIVGMTTHRKYFDYENTNSIDEGLIRHHSQYMFPGKLKKVRFSFDGQSIQAVLDRIPTAKIIEKKAGKYILEAESFGNGLKMFLLSQGAGIEVLSPKEFRDEMKQEIEKMYIQYKKEG